MVKSKINRVIIKATGPQPKATDLEGYTRYDIPWNDGTGENLYIWMKPDGKSQDIFIGSDENLKVVTRSRDIIFKTNTAGVVSSSQAQATLRVIQTNAVYTYRLILSVDHETLTAVGGTAKVSAQLEAKIGDEIIYTKEVNPTITLQGSTPGFSLNGSTLTVENRTTAIGNARTCTLLATVNTEETGEEVFSTIAVTQEGNYVESISLTKGNFSYANTVAAGQVVKPTSNGSTPVFTFTSGSTTTVVPSSTYGTVSRSTTYSSQASEGFSAANTETGAITVASRGSIIGNIRTSNTITRHESYSFVPASGYDAKGQIDGELDSQATVTQAKNVPVSVSVTPDFTYPSGDIPASGGTKTPSIDADITITWSSGGTSTADETGESGYTVTKTPNWSMTAADGFTIDSSTGTVTAENRGTTEGDSYTSGDITLTSEVTINISEEYGGGSVSDEQEITKDNPVTQAPNHRIQVFSKPTITEFTVADIPASGGTVNSGEVSYHQASTWYYDSGETAEGPSYTEGGSVQFGSAITAASLGTNVKSRSVVGTLTCTVSMNGQTSVEGDAVVYQQANAITSYGNVNLTVQTPINCDVLGGSYKITPTASQTITYTSEATRAGTINFAYAQKSAMSGFSLSGQSVTVTENKSTSVRNGYTVTVTATGEGSKSATKEVVFNQAAGTKSYANPVISVFTYPTIAAKGGTVTPTIEYSQTWGWNDSTTDGGTITTGAALSFTGSKVTSEGSVSASTKGTSVSGVTTVDTVTLKVTLNNKSVTKAFTVQQAANAITTYGNVTISGGTVADIPAAGGTISSMSGISASQTITYTSGATRAGDVDITYSTAVKASSLGTTVKARTKIGTLTATAKGEGSKSATKSLDVYQAANTATYGNVTITGGTIADIPARGGSASSMSGISASQTVSFTSGATRAGNVSISYSTAVSAPSLSTTVKARTKIGTLTATATGEGSKSATKAVDVYQAANSATYGNVSITGGSVSVIPASGGSVSSASGISASQTVSFTSGATRAGTVNIAYSSAVSAQSKGTTISNQTTAGTLTATATGEGSKKATKQFTVYQAKNVPIAAAINEHKYAYPTGAIPASGGTKTPSSSSSVKLTWSSGSTSVVTSSGATGITAEYTDRTYSMVAATGFSINTSTGVVTAADRGTTTGAERKSGNCSRHIKWTITVSDSYGGGSFVVEDTKTLTTPVTQQANTATYGAVSLTVQTPVSCDASGGDYRINPIYSQTVSFTSGDARAGSVSVTYTQKAAMAGFSLKGNIVTVTENKTTSARNGYTVTVKATGEGSKTASKDVVFNQSLGVKSYATPVITGFTYPTIAAKGGTVTPTVTYSQTWGWNGSTTGGGTITTGAALSFSGTGVNTSTGAVTAGTKGTTVSSATTITTATVKVTLNNKAATKTFTVQQAANAITSYGTVTISGGTVSDIPAKGGSVSAMSGISASQTITYTSESTRAGTVKITYSTAVSGTNLGTTIKNRTKLGTLTATATGEGSKSATKALDIYQAKNVPTTIVVGAGFSYPAGSIPASGGTKSPTLSGTVTLTWSSGSTSSSTAGSYTGYSVQSTRTWSMVAATGFSINTSTGVVTASNRGTTEGAARSCGNVSSTLTSILTITSSYGGGTISDSDTKTLTTPVSQTANTLSYSYANPTVTVAAVSDIPASGGTKSSSTVTYKQVRTNSYTSGSSTTTELTSGGTVSWSDAIRGSNLGTTAKARTKLGTLTATVTMNGKSGTGSVDVYQQANAITKTTYSTPTVTISSVADIPAKGGSVSTGTATYSQTKTDTYTSGSSKPTTLTSGGTVKWTTVSAGTKGTTVSARTEVDEITCTVTLNSKSGSATKMVFQAANSKNEVSRVITVSVPTGDIPAKGGTKTVTRSGVINYSFTSGATTTSSFTPTLSIEGTGFSLSGTTVTAANRTTVVGERRSATVTASYTGATSKEVTVWQQANAAVSITYGTPSVSLTVGEIAASGGTVSSGNVTYSQSRTQNYTSGSTSPMSALTTGGLVSYSTAVSGSGLGTTIKNRTKIGTLTATVTMNGKSGSKSADVYQAGNYVKSVDLTGFAIAYSKVVSAAGGTVSPSVTQGSVKFTFTSGASSSTTPSSTYGSLASSITYSGSAANGFSAPNSSSGAMTASDRDTTEGASRSSGTVTATKKVTWTHASSYSGGGTKTDSMTDTDYATQQANVKTPTTISYGKWQVSVSANRYMTSSLPCPAGGGTCTITRSASRTRTQNYSYTSGATSSTALSNETATPTLSISGTGASLSGTTVTWADRGATAGIARQATVTATYGGVEAKEIVYQAANSITSTTYGNPVVTITRVADIPASGGSVNTGSCTYSQSRTYTYSSGSTSAGSNLVSGGSVSWSTVSAGSKGTTLSERTSAGTITCTVTMNGKSGSKTVTVYQAANDYVLHWDDLEASGTESGIDAAGSNTLYPVKAVVKSGYSLTNAVEFSSGETLTANADISNFLQQHLTVTASNLPSWATVYETNPYLFIYIIIKVVIAANTGSARSATCTFRMYSDNGSYDSSVTLTLSQNAANHLDVSPTSLSFTASGGTKSISIDTNEPWTIS